MSSFLADLTGQMKAIWARLDSGQRMTVASVVFATFVGLGAILWFASQPDYVIVHTPQTGLEMQEAEAALVEAGIAVVPDGNSLRVDRDQFNNARSVLFRQGITGGGSDPSLSESLGSLIPDRETRLQMLDENRRRAAEAAVRGLEDVLDVTVSASKPKQSPFRNDDDKTAPSATASIRLRPGVDFFRVAPHVASQVASATGVPKQFVEVRDTRTHRKWQYDPETGNGVDMSDFVALEKSRSDELTHKAQSALDVVFPGGTMVMVNVELDNRWERRREVLRPEDPVVKSDRTSEETSQNGTVRGGDPGIASGTSDGQESIAAQGNQSTSKNKTRDRTFATENGELQSGKLAPDIKRITSAVLIDANNPDLAGQRDAVLNAFKGIIGWDPNRGDPEPEILQAPFPEPEELVAPPGPRVMDIVREWGPTAGQILGVILVLLFLRGMLKRTAPAKKSTKRAAQSGAEEIEEDLAPEEAARRIRKEIEKTISEDPAAISRLLESWLSEQKA